MKNITLTTVLLAIALLGSKANAQVKKTIAKPKTPIASTIAKAPLLGKIDFFAQNPDNLSQILTDEFKKLKITLTDIEDAPPTYNYGPNAEKLNTIFGNNKTLKFSNGITADIGSDENDAVNSVSFNINTGNTAHYKAIQNMLGLTTWLKINETETDTTYRKNNIFATTMSTKTEAEENRPASIFYFIGMEKTSPYTYTPTVAKAFDIEKLQIYDNAQDVGYSMVELFKKQGISLLYCSKNTPIVDGVLYGYDCNYNFSNGLHVVIGSNPNHNLYNISIDAKNPILFAKLKKIFNILQWDAGKMEENIANYSHKNINCRLFTLDKRMFFNINPLLNDIDARLANSLSPNLEDLVALYQSGTEYEVANTITSNYLNLAKYNNDLKKMVFDSLANPLNFYYKSPAGTMVNAFFDYKLSKDNTRQIMVASYDKAYLKTLLDDYNKNETYTNLFDVVAKPEENYITFFNKEIEATNAKEKEEAAAQAKAAREEYQRQQAENAERARLNAIEKERLRAEKDAKTAADIKQIGDALIKGLQDIQKAKKGGGK